MPSLRWTRQAWQFIAVFFVIAQIGFAFHEGWFGMTAYGYDLVHFGHSLWGTGAVMCTGAVAYFIIRTIIDDSRSSNEPHNGG